MSALGFTDQTQRLRRIVSNALDGASFEASRSEEEGRHVVIEAKRPDGRPVTVRFRAVRDAEATGSPAVGTQLRLKGVSAGGSGCLLPFVSKLFPALRAVPRGASRVRIEAGEAELDIICEDAEWWEDEPPSGGSS
jgi:hypothetical protein